MGIRKAENTTGMIRSHKRSMGARKATMTGCARDRVVEACSQKGQWVKEMRHGLGACSCLHWKRARGRLDAKWRGSETFTGEKGYL